MDTFTYAYGLFEVSSASSPTSDVINKSGGLFLLVLVVHRGFSPSTEHFSTRIIVWFTLFLLALSKTWSGGSGFTRNLSNFTSSATGHVQ